MMIVFSLLFAILRFTQRAYIIGSKVGLYWLLPFLHSDLYEVSFIVLHISGFFYRRVCGIYLRHENIPMPRQRSNSFGLRSGSSLPSSGASSASSLSRLYWDFPRSFFIVPATAGCGNAEETTVHSFCISAQKKVCVTHPRRLPFAFSEQALQAAFCSLYMHLRGKWGIAKGTFPLPLGFQ